MTLLVIVVHMTLLVVKQCVIRQLVVKLVKRIILVVIQLVITQPIVLIVLVDVQLVFQLLRILLFRQFSLVGYIQFIFLSSILGRSQSRTQRPNSQ